MDAAERRERITAGIVAQVILSKGVKPHYLRSCAAGFIECAQSIVYADVNGCVNHSDCSGRAG